MTKTKRPQCDWGAACPDERCKKLATWAVPGQPVDGYAHNICDEHKHANDAIGGKNPYSIRIR